MLSREEHFALSFGSWLTPHSRRQQKQWILSKNLLVFPMNQQPREPVSRGWHYVMLTKRYLSQEKSGTEVVIYKLSAYQGISMRSLTELHKNTFEGNQSISSSPHKLHPDCCNLEGCHPYSNRPLPSSWMTTTSCHYCPLTSVAPRNGVKWVHKNLQTLGQTNLTKESEISSFKLQKACDGKLCFVLAWCCTSKHLSLRHRKAYTRDSG